jgi:hypothetical protein
MCTNSPLVCFLISYWGTGTDCTSTPQAVIHGTQFAISLWRVLTPQGHWQHRALLYFFYCMLHVVPPIYLVESAVTHVRPAVLLQRSRKTRSEEPVERRWNLDSTTTLFAPLQPVSPCHPLFILPFFTLPACRLLLLPRWVSSQQLNFLVYSKPFSAIAAVSWMDLTLPVMYATVEVV